MCPCTFSEHVRLLHMRLLHQLLMHAEDLIDLSLDLRLVPSTNVLTTVEPCFSHNLGLINLLLSCEKSWVKVSLIGVHCELWLMWIAEILSIFQMRHSCKLGRPLVVIRAKVILALVAACMHVVRNIHSSIRVHVVHRLWSIVLRLVLSVVNHLLIGLALLCFLLEDSIGHATHSLHLKALGNIGSSLNRHSACWHILLSHWIRCSSSWTVSTRLHSHSIDTNLFGWSVRA